MSPWTSLPELAGALFPIPGIGHVVGERYDSLAAAPSLRMPALVVHGERDRIIPIGQGERVARALAGPVRWVRVADAGHNDLLARPEVWRELSAFLRAPPTAPPP